MRKPSRSADAFFLIWEMLANLHLLPGSALFPGPRPKPVAKQLDSVS